MDVEGSLGEISRVNMYIINFVDRLTNWPKAYAMPDKMAQIEADLILTEIFLKNGGPVLFVIDIRPEIFARYGTPVQLVIDNRPEIFLRFSAPVQLVTDNRPKIFP